MTTSSAVTTLIAGGQVPAMAATGKLASSWAGGAYVEAHVYDVQAEAPGERAMPYWRCAELWRRQYARHR